MTCLSDSLRTDEWFVKEWDRCAPWLDAALHRGGDTLTLNDVFDRVQRGLYHFWPAEDAAAVTQIIPGKRTEFNVLLGGGNMDTLKPMLEEMERFARAAGCVLMTILGRRGWERTFVTREAGFKPISTLYGKDLTA